MVDKPRTFRGTLITIALALIGLMFLYTTSLLAFVVGAAIVVLVLYGLYVVLGRVHRRVMGKKPSRRGGS